MLLLMIDSQTFRLRLPGGFVVGKKVSSMLATCSLWIGIVAAPAYAMEGHEGAEPAQDLSKVPPKQVEMYLDGFHNYKTDAGLPPGKQLQLRVAHFCVHNSPDLIQCMLFDTNGGVEGKHPRLIGIEYVITDKVYQSLTSQEKQYWHPHDGEVSSGMLSMPGTAADKEAATLNCVSTTWGKTWHAWNPERKGPVKDSVIAWPEVPVGPAKLMWSVKPEDETAQTKKVVVERKTNPAF
jgi:hypothetical protein